jgi:hypothetical protein
MVWVINNVWWSFSSGAHLLTVFVGPILVTYYQCDCNILVSQLNNCVLVVI